MIAATGGIVDSAMTVINSPRPAGPAAAEGTLHR